MSDQPEAIVGVSRYRVREPVTVEAIRCTGDNDDAVAAFAGFEWTCVPPGCYVVKGITGHFFTVDADRFAATYEPESLVMPRDEFGLVKWLQDALAEAIGPAWGLAAVGCALEAVTPVVEHAARAAAGSHEGIRLWMLDCNTVAAKRRERAEQAEAKLSAVAEYVRSRPSWITDPVESRLRKDAILAITGQPQERSDEKEGRGHEPLRRRV